MRANSRCSRTAFSPCVPPTINSPRKGVDGGGSPRLSRVVVNPYGAKPEELGPIETRALRTGDVIRFERSGGAGFGDPLTRAREAVVDDVRNGYISRDAAQKVYGLNDPPEE